MVQLALSRRSRAGSCLPIFTFPDDELYRHVCPTGAIRPITVGEKSAIHVVQKSDDTKDIAVDAERGVGCGFCEYFCPARPIAAITMMGNVEHHRV